jgi:hypothetical protein
MRLALVHVRLASRARESLCAVAREGAGRIDADAVVLARGTCNRRDKESDENERRRSIFSALDAPNSP